jgi:hypothetical protein
MLSPEESSDVMNFSDLSSLGDLCVLCGSCLDIAATACYAEGDNQGDERDE